MDFDLFDVTRSHVHYQLSSGTLLILSFDAVSVWPHAVWSLLHIQLCHRSRTVGPVRRDFPDLSPTQVLLRRKGCESNHQHCLSCHGLGLPLHDGYRERLDTIACWIVVFTSDSPVPLSVTTRISAISCSDEANVRIRQ